MKNYFAFDELAERAKNMTVVKLIVYILVSAVGLTAVAMVHQWSNDNSISLARLPNLFVMILGISATLWVAVYAILKLMKKISGDR
jgi:4-hydroxybenzoate polyprenyltransferase